MKNKTKSIQAQSTYLTSKDINYTRLNKILTISV